MPAVNNSVRNFDIVWTNAMGNQKILYHFLDYKNARRALLYFNESGYYLTEDKMAEKLRSNRNKRPRRNSRT